ncbi:MAG: glycosyltransferase family 4 protein [Alysiella sp.]|uniref:glycosyltransferase family 4 protein n=1 Tax=Alysiella sp. TaxID=1872483 RepID=UPI0026DC6F2E|nr:glycosyltransferase family 4 protein [Alysiella sp.]MDO4434448.1 glycosyltransferase family 4 protein [Alysiella sp.]
MYFIIQQPIKNLIRALWKALFAPWINKLPESPYQQKLLYIGQIIERRDWWWNHTLYQSVYREIMQTLKHDLAYDVIIVAPFLKRGGGDLGVLHHIQAQHEQGNRVLLITTDPTDSPWLNRLPETVQHLDLCKWHNVLRRDYLRVAVLTELLRQSTATTIHNVNNSDLCWQVFRYKAAILLSANKKLFCSVFCGTPRNGLFLGYADDYLPHCHMHLSRVFCDTQWYPNEIIQRWHLPPDLFQALYFPCLLPQAKICQSQTNAPVLWASRFSTQKHPELLYVIAQRLPEQTFHVYGACESNCEDLLTQLQALPNVTYFGVYDNFASLLVQQKYAAFLYTSAYDGMPNVLLEAIASGLPVIASDVGGVHELIHPNMLLPHNDDIDAHINQIQNVLHNTPLLQQSWQYSHSLLQERHSWQHFVHSLATNQGYFPQEQHQHQSHSSYKAA